MLFLVAEKSGYQSVKTLVVAQGGSGGQKPEGEGQPDGVGIFAKFRGTCSDMYMCGCIINFVHQ